MKTTADAEVWLMWSVWTGNAQQLLIVFCVVPLFLFGFYPPTYPACAIVNFRPFTS